MPDLQHGRSHPGTNAVVGRGGELPALAARHPARVARVGYLDAAYDGADRPTPEGPEGAASPDRFASYEDYLDFVRSVLPDDMWGRAKL
jgi:pimeloyl-ACP methyl ester carboxylesterase